MAVIKARYQFIDPYITDLRATVGLYLGWIPNQYADQTMAENWYDVLKNDPTVYQSMHLLSIMAAGEYIEVECKKPVLKLIIEKVLGSIDDFTHVRKSLIYSSVLFGLGVHSKHYRPTRWPEFTHNLVWQVPHKMREIDRRRLRIERDPVDRNIVTWTIYDPYIDAYVMLPDRAQEPKAEIALQDYLFCIHEWEETNPYFRGIGDVVYALAYVKTKVVQYWADLCESYAKPFLIATIDTLKASINASLGSGFTTAKDRANQIIDAFEAARARHMVVLDKSDKVDFHEHGSTSNNILRDMLDYCDQKIQLVILGAELTTSTSGSGAGSFALGQIHRQATQAIVQYNRLRLEEVLEKELVYDFYLRNKKNFVELGLKLRPGDVKLKIRIKAEEQAQQGEFQPKKTPQGVVERPR
jgi:hypothetical protein